MRIPWLFPIFIFSLTFNKIPWLFPDFCQVWNFPDFSLTAGHPVFKSPRGQWVNLVFAACPQHVLGAHFTNVFSITIQMRWKIHFAFTSILTMWSLQIFAHDMTAMLSWHVQKFVAIWCTVIELQWDEIPIEFETWAKKSLVKWAPEQLKT